VLKRVRAICIALTATFVCAYPVAAFAVPLGLISFDTLIPGPDGVNAFNVGNLTGPNGLPPDFPVADSLTLLNATLNVTRTDGSTQLFVLGDVGPGSIDPVSLNLLFPDSDTFASALFEATLSDVDFLLSDGSTFHAASSAISTLLSGAPLAPGDFALIDVRPQSTVPHRCPSR
jgi:hypothetical protein